MIIDQTKIKQEEAAVNLLARFSFGKGGHYGRTS
jgi:hypothetical protein